MTRKRFGVLPDGTTVEILTLEDGDLQVEVLTYGCIIKALRAPDRRGTRDSIVLGCDDLESYLLRSRYLGALVGRYANRISQARFSIDGRNYDLGANEPPHHLHGGFRGFDKRVWSAEWAHQGSAIEFRRRSADGEEGYPGNLDVSVVYQLENGELRLRGEARSDAPTHVNLTQHSYFNLRSRGDIRSHLLLIDADAYLPVDDQLIPTGDLHPVAGTPFDFREAVEIGSRGCDYDHHFVLSPQTRSTSAARVVEPDTGRTLELRTTEPGLQFYSGQAVNFEGLCLEPQHFPDSPHQTGFPSTLLRPGQTYTWVATYRFGLV